MRKSKLSIIVVITVVVVGLAIYLHSTRPVSNPTSFTQQQQVLNPVFQEAENKFKDANWSKPTVASEQTAYGNLSGTQITGQITSQAAFTDHFESANTLRSMGYEIDPSLSADGPGSSVWGYIKKEGPQNQVVLLSYTTIPTSSNSNEPLQFNCPCKVDLKVFVSDAFNNAK